ncbi:MAG TPA: hypothetical protein VHA33_02305 [Candidatus Angelobacter sp.]|nr:hypothetical protein [Candidatus Angelobacter sp.]
MRTNPNYTPRAIQLAMKLFFKTEGPADWIIGQTFAIDGGR